MKRSARLCTIFASSLSLFSMTACSGAVGSSTGAPNIPAPLATSLESSTGDWATFAMGHLQDPANTFWQLLYRPSGAQGKWSDQVGATAAATNGGLALAGGGGVTVVAVLPSQGLRFSPVIYTSVGPKSWSDSLIDAAVASSAGALAVGPNGETAALLAEPKGQQVLVSRGHLSSFSTYTTLRRLGSAPVTRGCLVRTLTAVGFAAGRPLVGGSCARAGAVGIFARSGAGWRSIGPALPAPLRNGTSEVLRIAPGTGGNATTMTALIGVSDAGRASILDASYRLDAFFRRGQWLLSPPLTLSSGEKILSFGPTAPGGAFVLLGPTKGSPRLFTIDMAAEPRWAALPELPSGTATVAQVGPDEIDAFVPSGARLVILGLVTGTARWKKIQQLEIPLQYGSSS